MITDKQIQNTARGACANGKDAIELKDGGERGSGRLAIIVKPRRPGRVTAEWYAVFYRRGKRAKAKLGSYPAMTVAEARLAFLTYYARRSRPGRTRRLLGAGRRRQAPSASCSTLMSLTSDATASDRPTWPTTTSCRQFLGPRRLSAPTGLLPASPPATWFPIWRRSTAGGARALANMVRSYLCAAFNFGLKAENDFTKAEIDTRWGIKTNPVTAIPSDAGGRRAGDRFLSPAEFRTFWLWLDSYRERSVIASGAMLKMATGQRTEEVLRISDTGYDRQKAMVNWEKTKNGLAHSIPVPHQAVAILDRLVPNSHGLFFPHRRNPAASACHQALMAIIRKFLDETPGFASFTARDLRRTWKTLAGDAGIPKELRDRLQNHARGGDVSSRQDDRYDYLPERRAAMAKWAAYMDLVIAGTVDQLGAREGNVVSIGTALGAQS